MMRRLAARSGEWIDRTQTVSFTFEGTSYEGFTGDTISSALAANGVMMLGRSFKYHRPRGILSFANHDVNAMFQVGSLPNVRGDITPLQSDMDVKAVNTFGGLAKDRARFLDKLSRFLPVGFYYKAFHHSHTFTHWEERIRPLAGLGAIDFDAPHVRTPKRYAFCDVLVIGGGNSGVRAALEAAESGAKVLLVDENLRLPNAIEHPNVGVLSYSFVAGCYADRWVAVIEPHRMTKVRAGKIILATGAIEQPVVFRNNDLPGVMLVSAAQRLLHRYSIACGRSVVVIAASRSAYAAALELLEHGIEITHLIDIRAADLDGDLAATLNSRKVQVLSRTKIVAAHAKAHHSVARIDVKPIAGGRKQSIDCDAVLMNGGWAPALQLLLQAGGKARFDESRQMHVPFELPDGYEVVGRAAGEFGALTSSNQIEVPIHAAPEGKDFVDFDEDLQVKDLENAAQEGFDSIELLKRYSTVGMGPSQGKLSNIAAARVLARVRGESLNDTGLTTARPMVHPVPMKHLAGRGFSPERRSPLFTQHEEHNAAWMLAGNWRRPEYYHCEDLNRRESIAEEIAAVRNAAGLIDVSTLGKIEVHGPAAGEFIERAYTGRYTDLKVGMTRYGLLLDEAGTLVDDGVIGRVHEHCYYFTTTTGNSAAVYRELLRLNALWGLDCSLVNVTGHRGAINLAGPQSRAILSQLTQLDLNDGAFPYLALREANVAGVRARLMRVGFVGELGFEIHVPYSQTAIIWNALVKLGARPCGVEAQRVLRLEKGHFIIGQDTDGLTNPFEAQAAWAVRMNKPFFVGQRSLRILERRGPRQLLVGFQIDECVPALKECHLVIDGDAIAGRVTSVCWSPSVHKTIGLAMVRPDLAALETRLSIRSSEGALVHAAVVPTPFYDRDNSRQKLEVAA